MTEKRIADPRELRLPCLRLEQTAERVLYSFAVDGKLVSQFAVITRIHRDKDHRVHGYQRPEVISHIAEIRSYIESDRPMIPNAVVLAFDSRVRFEPDRRAKANGTTPGTLIIPIITSGKDDEKPGFVVDGQQRLAAVREAQVKHFPLFVTAFITDDLAEQTEQFILVNSTKPLPKGLIYELLPVTEAPLPRLLHRRRYPAQLLDRLNLDPESPFHQLVKTPTCPDGFVNHNAVLRMVEQSLTDGSLYRLRKTSTKEAATESMLALLKNFWTAVRDVFPEAWGIHPKRSRLMHGAGIVSMGLLMDTIADRFRDETVPTPTLFHDQLLPLQAVCRWTDGVWYFGPGQQRKWNEIQNTSKDIQLLADHLLMMYRNLVSDAEQR